MSGHRGILGAETEYGGGGALCVSCESGNSMATSAGANNGGDSAVFSYSLLTMRSVDLGVVIVMVGTEARSNITESADTFLRGFLGPDLGTDNFS